MNIKPHMARKHGSYAIKKGNPNTLPKIRLGASQAVPAVVSETATAELHPEARKEEICKVFPGVDWREIQSAARYYGYRRKKKPYKITGIISLDQSRSRCYDIGWTMRDFDEEAGTKRYFQTRGSRSKYPNFRAINRGVKALGGRLEIRWDEQR